MYPKYEEGKSRIEYYTLENGMKKSFSYNSLGNISSMEYSAEDKKTGFSYIYDNNFNIASRTSLDTNKTSWFTYDAANRLTKSQMYGAFETRENLSEGKLSQIDLDLAGTKNAESYFEVLPQNITLDTSARSFVYNFERAVNVNKIELFPDVSTHRVRERDIRIYCKESEGSDWDEITNWKLTKDVRNGSLSFKFKEAFKFKQIKIHCIWDDRNFQNVSLDLNATFKVNPLNLLRIWAFVENRIEQYEYDGNSNRVQLTENGINHSYEYYKNINGGNTARVMTDGKWWYTYDANGNRTARASKAVQDGNSIIIDKTNEYWEYTWDLWNRLIKVEQHNAPDNAQNVLVEYTYDVLNHRIERISKTKGAEEKTQYGYGRNGAIAYKKKIVGNTVTTRSYAYLNNQIMGFADKQGNTEIKYYTVTDIQGSVTEVYDKDKKLVWKSGYTAFGIKAGETTCKIDFDGLYTGCDYDVETGLTYHWNRWRSEDGSFWLTQAPARDGVNWYGYCNNTPLIFTDPLGLSPYNNLNDAMEDYYTNYATEADRKQLQFFGLINQASMGNKSAQNTLNYAFYQANKEMLKDFGDASENASLVFLAIGLPEVSTVLGGIDTVSDLIIGADKVINGYKNNDSKMRTEGWLEIASSTSEFVASEVIIKGITNKVSSSINVTIGKNGRYYELGRRGALKSKKAIQKLVKKDIAEGYFGQNIAPELASQIVDKVGEAALVVSGVKEKKEKLSIGERIFPQLRKGGKDAEKK